MKKLLTAKELSEHFGVTRVTIYRWLNGTCEITPSVAMKFAKLTGIKPERWLLRDRYTNPYFEGKNPYGRK